MVADLHPAYSNPSAINKALATLSQLSHYMHISNYTLGFQVGTIEFAEHYHTSKL